MTCYDKALSLLSSREHTAKELSEKLARKGFPRSEIETAVRRLENEGALSERRYVECFVRSRMRRNPEGRSILALRLAEKGSPREVFLPYLDEFFDSGEHIPYVKAELEKQARLKGKRKALLSLMKKGFGKSFLEALAKDIPDKDMLCEVDVDEVEYPDVE